jgi:hypothetical protein
MAICAEIAVNAVRPITKAALRTLDFAAQESTSTPLIAVALIAYPFA